MCTWLEMARRSGRQLKGFNILWKEGEATVSSLFDPLGFIAPYTIKAKLLLRDQLYRKKLRWHNMIYEPEKMQWSRWLDDLPQLKYYVHGA